MTGTGTHRPSAHVELVHTMGTVVTLDVRGPGPDPGYGAAVADATDCLHRIDATLSTWIPDSWASRLCAGAVALDDCPSQVRTVMALAEEVAAATDGFFTPRWRADAPGPDPTGLVKGWAAQRASDVLLAHGCVDHAVNAAGDVVLSGLPVPEETGDPQAWRIGISDPAHAGALLGVVELPAGPWRWAVATSGTAERGRHVVDPHTGAFPGAVASATVVARVDAPLAEAGAWADGCATALVAAGADAPGLLARLPVRGLVLEADGVLTDPDGLLLAAPV